jgi:hypothetical protein
MENKLRTIFFVCVCTCVAGVYAGKSYVYIVAFDNHTNSDYIVSKRPRPISGKTGTVYTVEAADWTPILIVKAHEIGKKSVLVRDPELFGTQIKLAPVSGSLPTVYLKGGIKMSGSCKEFWWDGPYALDVATSEDVLVNEFKNYNVVKRVRYCSYHKSEALIHLYADGIKIEEEHNIKILDDQKVALKVEHKGEKSE